MLKTVNNEKGIALILALMVLVALTLLGIAALNTSTLDMKVAANERAAIQAQYAAEAGIGETVGRMNLDSADTNYISTPTLGGAWPINWTNNPHADYKNWRKGFKREIKTTDGKAFFNYTVTVSIKPSEKGGNWVLFYNHSSNYMKSPFKSGGMPVYLISSIGSSGSYKSNVYLDITKDAYTYEIKGGFTSNGPVDLKGTPTIDGTSHTETGAPGGTCSTLSSAMPGVFANGTTDPPSSGTVTGTVPWERGGSTATTPWGALGLSESAFNDLFTNKQTVSYTGARAGEIWIGGTGTVTQQANGNIYNGTSQSVAGSGILVVHNPKFVAGECPTTNPKYPWSENTDTTHPCYKEKAPAILTVSKDTFKGLIVADQVKLSGNVEIIGAIISLTTISTDATAAGNPTIKYSCEAIEKYAGGKVKRKLAWNVIR